MDLEKEFREINKKFEELKNLVLSQRETQKASELPPILSLKHVCRLLNITEQGLWKKRVKGEIRTKATGRRVYVERAEFERFIASLPEKNKSNKKTLTKK